SFERDRLKAGASRLGSLGHQDEVEGGPLAPGQEEDRPVPPLVLDRDELLDGRTVLDLDEELAVLAASHRLLDPEVRGEILPAQSQGGVSGLVLGDLVSRSPEDRFRQRFRDTTFCLEKVHPASGTALEVPGNTQLLLIVLTSPALRRAQNL